MTGHSGEKKKSLRTRLAPEWEKVRRMRPKERLQYVLMYYWLWLLGIGGGLFLVIFLLYRMCFTVKDYWFYGMFANTMAEAGNGSQLWKDFVDYARYDTRLKKVELNGASYFDPTLSGGTNNSYYQAFVALAESGDLDVLVMGTEGLKGIGSSGRLLDLTDARAGALLEKYSDRLVWCEPYDTAYESNLVPVGIDVSDSLLVERYGLYEGDCALGLGAWSSRPEAAQMFLAFIFEEDVWDA